MKTNRIRTVLPGKPGTKEFVRLYGDNLVCVRYRYSAQRREVVKTVELVVSRRPWNPEKSGRIAPNRIVGVRVNYGEVHLGRVVRHAGGVWDRKARLWRLRYDQVKMLGLEGRMVSD